MASKREWLLVAPLLSLLLVIPFWQVATMQGIVITNDIAVSDMANLHHPVRHFLGSELREGRLPLWLPDVYMGYPIQAEGHDGGLLPPEPFALRPAATVAGPEPLGAVAVLYGCVCDLCPGPQVGRGDLALAGRCRGLRAGWVLYCPSQAPAHRAYSLLDPAGLAGHRVGPGGEAAIFAARGRDLGDPVAGWIAAARLL